MKFTDGRFTTYLYDAAGAKLTVKNYSTTGSLTTTTDYVGGFIYVNSTLNFFSSPEGRVVKNGSKYEYQYAIGDHQGNTRILFISVTPAPVSTKATFEADGADQVDQFTNVNPSLVFEVPEANNTPSGKRVIALSQGYPRGAI